MKYLKRLLMVLAALASTVAVPVAALAASVSNATVVAQVQKLLSEESGAKATCLWIIAGDTEAAAMVRVQIDTAPLLFKLVLEEGSWRLSHVIGDDGLWKSTALPLELGHAASPEQLTMTRLNSLRRGLMTYFLDMNAYPFLSEITRLADGGGVVPFGLEPGFFPPGSLPVTDGWGRAFRYSPLGAPQRTKEGDKEMVWAVGYRITSSGTDGSFDTADDRCLENGKILDKCSK